MESTELSVITVSRNDSSGLIDTRKTVAMQSGTLLEHIVVDGSDIEDVELMSRLEADGVTIVKGIQDGPYAAMNAGASVAHGRCLAFLNSGDTFYSTESATNLIELCRDSAWGYGSIRTINGNQQRLYHFSPFSRTLLRLGLRFVPHPASVFRRQLFNDLGGFNLDFAVAADQEFFLRLSQDFKPAVTRKLIASFQLGGMSTRSASDVSRDFALMREVNDELLAGSARVDKMWTLSSGYARSIGRISRELWSQKT